MSKDRIGEEVVSPWLKQLAIVRSLAAKFKQDGESSSEINLLFETVERHVGGMKDVFRRVEKWESDVINEFELIARHMDDISDATACDFPTFQSKLRTIELEMSSLSDRVNIIPPLELPVVLIESGNTSSSPSSSPRSSEEWRRRLELGRKILQSPAMSNLQVSYDNLDLQLKMCFLCFSIFPENSIIKKRTLIYWWIGEGLVTPRRESTAQEIGDHCFRRLIDQGLVEPVYRKSDHEIRCCRIHPWIRWMLISVAKRAQFFDFDSEGCPTSDFSASRRACLCKAATSLQMSRRGESGGQSPEELLTLFNVNDSYLSFEKSWFCEMGKLGVLQLGRWQTSAKHHIEVDSTEFLEGLGFFKHLKYLSLQGISRITDLPASISKITNLRILDLRACHNLERLTPGITCLEKLTHLDVSECHLLEHMPKGIGALAELQVLKGFVMGDSTSRADPCRLSELSKLDKLRKLSINIGSKAMVTATEEELNELGGLRALRSLTITWGLVALPSTKENTRLLKRPATTSLSLPPLLEKLDIRCFPNKLAPEWLSPSRLTSLKKLYIRGGLLASLGHQSVSEKWNVQVLRLRFLNELEAEWSQLYQGFPCLAYVEVINCNKLMSFPGDKDGVWMRE